MKRELLDVLVCPQTGGPLSLDVLETDGDEVLHGVLCSEVARYPILEGIPVMRGDVESLVGQLLAGRAGEATAHAAFDDLRRSRRRQLRDAVAPSGSAVDRLLSRLPRPDDRGGEVLRSSHDAPSLVATRHAYLHTAARSVDAHDYFSYRFSIPRHVVALACIDASAGSDGVVLDLGCGVGHLTWSITSVLPGAEVVGVDPSYFQLWDARRVAPAASFVCADGTAMPFRSEVFQQVLAGDVLSFVDAKWSVTREVERVLAPGGTSAFTSVINSRQRHTYAGTPLTPGGWRRLVEHLPHRLLADDEIVDRYLSGRGLPAARDPSDEDLEGARTLTVLAARAPEHEWADGPDLRGWPHARGPLALNPLYRQDSADADGVSFVRQEPSRTFHDDNPQAWTYLPVGFRLSWPAIDAARSGDPHPELDPLVARLAILSLPVGYPGPSWPDGPRPAVQPTSLAGGASS